MPPSRRWLGTNGRLDRLSSYPLTVPILLAILVLAIGAQVACVYKIPSPGNDEPAHLGYVGTLATGDLPTIDSPIVDDPARYGDLAESLQGWDEAHQDIWTANHAPLFHLALVPLFLLSQDDPRSVFIAMRLVNTAGFALWILLVGMIARELVPRRPALPALASLVALTPTLTVRSAFLINDGMSSAASLLAILMVIRMLRSAITPGRLTVAALAGTVAAGTRASGVLTVAICTLVLLVVVWRRDGWRPGWLAAGVVGLVPALATGWFYVRNLRLYGDFTGQDQLLDKFDRSPVGNVLDTWSIPGISEAVLTAPVPLLALVVLVPIAVVRSLREHRRSVDPAWVLLAVLTGLTVVNMVAFLAAGGGFHDRYLMPIMPFPATLIALAMLGVGRSAPAVDPDRREWLVATAWSVVLLLWLAGTVVWLQQHYIYSLQAHLPVGGPFPDLLVGVAVVTGALVVATMAGRAATMAPRRRVRGTTAID